jgi:hypothetical protein
MAYTINKFNGEQLIVLEDGTIDTSTSLGLVGRNYVGYGETQNENFVFLLENFANDAPPNRPLQGQIWYNTTNNLTYAYDGTNWLVIGSAVLSEVAPNQATESNPNPPTPALGSLWLRTPVNTLNVWNGTSWSFIGPEAVPGFGTTRARSGTIQDSNGINRPVIFLEINNSLIGICSATAFTVNPDTPISNFNSNIIAGINLSTTSKIGGSITGNANSADRLSTGRFINNVIFDGQSNITIKSSTTNRLTRGEYLTGNNFDGSETTTWGVDATSANVIGKVVVRNSEGGFAAGTITANLVGNVTGDVSSLGTSRFNVIEANQFIGATLTGNAFSASQLETPRRINGVAFDATRDITVTAAANTLTGNTLNSTITTSTLTSVGTLVNLNVADAGINIGSSGQLQLFADSGTPTIRSNTGTLNFDIGASGPDVSFVNSARSLSLGGPNAPAIIGDNTTNLGITGYKFNNVYANNFLGNATTATLSASATNLVGGGLGAIPYQTASGTTTMLGLGVPGTVLTAQAGGVVWATVSRESLTKGSYVNLVNTANPAALLDSFNGLVAATISVDATTTNTANKLVARDGSGNFAAGTITASLVGSVTGNVTGNASTASALQTSRNINGVAFNGTTDITISATDPSKVPLVGGSMSGYLTLNANPINALHAAPKQYVDSRLPQYTIISGASSAVGFTNQVGSFNFNSNYFDVFPPVGKSMANIVAFIPSVNYIAYAGVVNGDDSTVCTYSYLGDRIRVYVQNTEQRAIPAANYLVIWS